MVTVKRKRILILIDWTKYPQILKWFPRNIKYFWKLSWFLNWPRPLCVLYEIKWQSCASFFFFACLEVNNRGQPIKTKYLRWKSNLNVKNHWEKNWHVIERLYLKGHFLKEKILTAMEDSLKPEISCNYYLK